MKRWLSIIGIGEDGVEGLSQTARDLIASASLVAGSARQLELASLVISGERYQWPSPFSDGIAHVLSKRGEAVAVLASGDPFFYGVGVTLARSVSAEEFICLPSPSSISLAASRLGWALQEVVMVSLHGKPMELLFPHLYPNARILALTWDETTPGKVLDALRARGFGASRVYLLERLGGPNERVREFTGSELSDIDPLNVLAIEVEASLDALVLPRAPGLPDYLFESDGQMTKREVRAVSLSELAPNPGALLWDVGGGSGTISIEWMLSHPTCRAIAVEKHPERLARIKRNAAHLGVPGLAVADGEAPAALEGLEAPDAIFIGGGLTAPQMFETCWGALKPGGRLVANTVSLESEVLLLALYKEHGGSLTRISIDRADPVGRMTGWRPSMPVIQWSVRKP